MTWNDITIKQYLALNDILLSDFDDAEKMIQIANVIYNCDVTELPLLEYNEKINNLAFIHTKLEPTKLNSKYVINGNSYICNTNIESIQANQFIDFQNYMKSKDMIGCISCFFIPEGHKYNDGYNMLDVKNDIEKLSIVVGNSLSFFFKKQYVILLILSQRYSLQQMKEIGMSKKKIKEMQDHLTTLGIANLVSILQY